MCVCQQAPPRLKGRGSFFLVAVLAIVASVALPSPSARAAAAADGGGGAVGSAAGAGAVSGIISALARQDYARNQFDPDNVTGAPEAVYGARSPVNINSTASIW